MATSNFYNQDGFDLWAADFSLPIYPIDENGEEIPDSTPIDYDFDDIAYREAEAKADELNAVLKFFKIELTSGHYVGVQTFVNDDNCPDEWWMERYFDFNEYGFDKYAITARFSNGETWYSKTA